MMSPIRLLRTEQSSQLSFSILDVLQLQKVMAACTNPNRMVQLDSLETRVVLLILTDALRRNSRLTLQMPPSTLTRRLLTLLTFKQTARLILAAPLLTNCTWTMLSVLRSLMPSEASHAISGNQIGGRTQTVQFPLQMATHVSELKKKEPRSHS